MFDPAKDKHPIENVQWVDAALLKANGDCLEWYGARNKGGYGTHGKGDKRTLLAHRKVYEDIHGVRLTPDQCVCHSCDNPPCINPDHLFLGTRQENTQDRHNKGRDNRPIGSKHPRTNLTEDIVRTIKADERKYTKIATDMGLKYHVVADIKMGRSWTHV